MWTKGGLEKGCAAILAGALIDGATSVTGTDLDENCEEVVESCPCWTYEALMEFPFEPNARCIA